MINPYEPSNPNAEVIPNSVSPLLDELRVEAVPHDPQPTEKRPSLPRTFGKWLLICSVSAAPSFILGSLASNSQHLGMLTGIALFIVGYTWLDRYTWKYTWRKNPVIRRILRIMYTTRVAISASLIGTPLDRACGMLALGPPHSYFKTLQQATLTRSPLHSLQPSSRALFSTRFCSSTVFYYLPGMPFTRIGLKSSQSS